MTSQSPLPSSQNILEIRDPQLNQADLLRQVDENIAHRVAAGGYGPAVAQLGPTSLQRTYADDETFNQPELSGGSQATPSGVVVTDFPGLNQAISELIASSTLHAPQFQSQVPVLGPVIVLVRKFWNWMSTKWYVLPILYQQSLINARLGRIVSDLTHWQSHNARSMAQLRDEVRQLEARLAEVERRP